MSGIVDHWQTCMTVAAENEGLPLAPQAALCLLLAQHRLKEKSP